MGRIIPIAVETDDSVQVLKEMVDRQLQKPGFGFDPYFYRSQLAYQRELDQLIFRSWLYAAHVSEIPDNGDYVLFNVAQDSLIITRDEKGDVRALHNICRHRGSRVCEAQAGNQKNFVCPYHGWVYSLDGSLRPPRDSEVIKDFDPKDYNLKPVSIEIFMGMIFVNFDIDAAPLLPAFASLQAPLGAYRLEQAKVAHQQTYIIDANWKFCLENYLECYHCASSHKAYARMHSLKELKEKVAPLNKAMLARAESVTGVKDIGLSLSKVYNDAPQFGACISAMRYALYEGYQTGSEDGKPVAPLMGDMQGYDGGAGDFQLGPLSFMLNYPDHCVLYRFIPRSLSNTDMQVVWLVNGDAEEGKDFNTEQLKWLWHNTSLEDEYIIKRNSMGVHSKFYEPGPYHPEYEALCMQFIDWYLQHIV